jgi:hypothetical protein
LGETVAPGHAFRDLRATVNAGMIAQLPPSRYRVDGDPTQCPA